MAQWLRKIIPQNYRRRISLRAVAFGVVFDESDVIDVVFARWPDGIDRKGHTSLSKIIFFPWQPASKRDMVASSSMRDLCITKVGRSAHNLIYPRPATRDPRPVTRYHRAYVFRCFGQRNDNI